MGSLCQNASEVAFGIFSQQQCLEHVYRAGNCLSTYEITHLTEKKSVCVVGFVGFAESHSVVGTAEVSKVMF